MIYVIYVCIVHVIDLYDMMCLTYMCIPLLGCVHDFRKPEGKCLASLPSRVWEEPEWL